MIMANAIKSKKWVFAMLVFSIMTSGCMEKPKEVIRTVELHYINGEIETRVLRGSTYHEPRIHAGYTPYYTDIHNDVYGVVRFQVLKVDTIQPTSRKSVKI